MNMFARGQVKCLAFQYPKGLDIRMYLYMLDLFDASRTKQSTR